MVVLFERPNSTHKHRTNLITQGCGWWPFLERETIRDLIHGDGPVATVSAYHPMQMWTGLKPPT
jgi:hypothetical protein